MSKKLAIAMFGQKRLSREGGVEIVVKELCTRMAQNGCDVTCYNRAGHHVSGAEYDDTVGMKIPLISDLLSSIGTVTFDNEINSGGVGDRFVLWQWVALSVGNKWLLGKGVWHCYDL